MSIIDHLFHGTIFLRDFWGLLNRNPIHIYWGLIIDIKCQLTGGYIFLFFNLLGRIPCGAASPCNVVLAALKEISNKKIGCGIYTVFFFHYGCLLGEEYVKIYLVFLMFLYLYYITLFLQCVPGITALPNSRIVSSAVQGLLCVWCHHHNDGGSSLPWKKFCRLQCFGSLLMRQNQILLCSLRYHQRNADWAPYK